LASGRPRAVGQRRRGDLVEQAGRDVPDLLLAQLDLPAIVTARLEVREPKQLGPDEPAATALMLECLGADQGRAVVPVDACRDVTHERAEVVRDLERPAHATRSPSQHTK